VYQNLGYTYIAHISNYNTRVKIKGDVMKNLLFTALVGLAMVTFTGCTTGSDAEAGAKCSTSKKCAASGKCSTNKAVPAKCAASGKCSTGKCGK